MDHWEQIRRAYFIDGKSIRRIAREGLHDRLPTGRGSSPFGPMSRRETLNNCKLRWDPAQPTRCGKSCLTSSHHPPWSLSRPVSGCSTPSPPIFPPVLCLAKRSNLSFQRSPPNLELVI